MSRPTEPHLVATRTFAEELGQLLRLALPIAFVQLGMMAMNFVDVALVDPLREVLHFHCDDEDSKGGGGEYADHQ